MLRLQQLRFSRADTAPERSIDWQFDLQAHAGTVTSIVGSSGCGKSTLLELIAGLLHPCAGQLHWNNQDLLALTAGQRPVSLLFQQHNLFEHLNTLDNVLLGHRGKVTANVQENALQILSELKMAEYVHARADQLSGGQQQRVALARTLLRKSHIILLDEPFSALDEETRQRTRPLVRSLADKHQCCVLMVTHDERDSDAIADRRLQLIDGQLR